MTYPMTPVESSNVEAVAYDDKTRQLQVQFKKSGTYTYDGVPPSIGNAFPYLESKGKGVWQLLRGKYPYSKG